MKKPREPIEPIKPSKTENRLLFHNFYSDDSLASIIDAFEKQLCDYGLKLSIDDLSKIKFNHDDYDNDGSHEFIFHLTTEKSKEILDKETKQYEKEYKKYQQKYKKYQEELKKYTEWYEEETQQKKKALYEKLKKEFAE